MLSSLIPHPSSLIPARCRLQRILIALSARIAEKIIAQIHVDRHLREASHAIVLAGALRELTRCLVIHGESL
ncbi:MAG: hypothetical protein DMF57_07615 [Acidobacteria bacterium]|nr:MAG: hypothetical protein DMF57_07615 [Acidobacteriota bacterium]